MQELNGTELGLRLVCVRRPTFLSLIRLDVAPRATIETTTLSYSMVFCSSF